MTIDVQVWFETNKLQKAKANMKAIIESGDLTRTETKLFENSVNDHQKLQDKEIKDALRSELN